MGFETSNLTPENAVHLEWPAEFTTEEIQILEEAAKVYNGMRNLDQMGMGDTADTMAQNDVELLQNAKKICESKEYRLESLIEQVQTEAEQNYTTAE
ncbi:hypothetical protein KBC40_02780 [Patescibacteria group bacterium]|nr:hypothetical protein [Patescibacteria group bacterium]